MSDTNKKEQKTIALRIREATRMLELISIDFKGKESIQATYCKKDYLISDSRH